MHTEAKAYRPLWCPVVPIVGIDSSDDEIAEAFEAALSTGILAAEVKSDWKSADRFSKIRMLTHLVIAERTTKVSEVAEAIKRYPDIVLSEETKELISREEIKEGSSLRYLGRIDAAIENAMKGLRWALRERAKELELRRADLLARQPAVLTVVEERYRRHLENAIHINSTEWYLDNVERTMRSAERKLHQYTLNAEPFLDERQNNGKRHKRMSENARRRAEENRQRAQGGGSGSKKH